MWYYLEKGIFTIRVHKMYNCTIILFYAKPIYFIWWKFFFSWKEGNVRIMSNISKSRTLKPECLGAHYTPDSAYLIR